MCLHCSHRSRRCSGDSLQSSVSYELVTGYALGGVHASYENCRLAGVGRDQTPALRLKSKFGLTPERELEFAVRPDHNRT